MDKELWDGDRFRVYVADVDYDVALAVLKFDRNWGSDALDLVQEKPWRVQQAQHFGEEGYGGLWIERIDHLLVAIPVGGRSVLHYRIERAERGVWVSLVRDFDFRTMIYLIRRLGFPFFLLVCMAPSARKRYQTGIAATSWRYFPGFCRYLKNLNNTRAIAASNQHTGQEAITNGVCFLRTKISADSPTPDEKMSVK